MDFIDWVKNTFFLQKRHAEVPESKTLAPEVRKIKGEVCRLYNVDEEDLLVSKRGTTNEPRHVAIYLTKKLTGNSLQEIGREFGIHHYSSVSTVIERTQKKAGTERSFRKRIEKLKMDLKVSQEQTLLGTR
jgi:putative transposase